MEEGHPPTSAGRGAGVAEGPCFTEGPTQHGSPLGHPKAALALDGGAQWLCVLESCGHQKKLGKAFT